MQQQSSIYNYLSEWAYKEYFVGAIIDDKIGESLEYRDFIKWPELRNKYVIRVSGK